MMHVSLSEGPGPLVDALARDVRGFVGENC